MFSLSCQQSCVKEKNKKNLSEISYLYRRKKFCHQKLWFKEMTLLAIYIGQGQKFNVSNVCLFFLGNRSGTACRNLIVVQF